jgi:hypothetical protein
VWFAGIKGVAFSDALFFVGVRFAGGCGPAGFRLAVECVAPTALSVFLSPRTQSFRIGLMSVAPTALVGRT